MHGQSPFDDLRQRVIEGIERGLSCRQAAERFGLSASSAIRWRDRLKKQGNVAAKRAGRRPQVGPDRSRSGFPPGEVAETPDLPRVALPEKLQARGVSAGIGTLWRLFDPLASHLKKPAHATEQQRGDVKPFAGLRSPRGVVRGAARS